MASSTNPYRKQIGAHGVVSRRELFALGARYGIGLSSLAAILAACGDSGTDEGGEGTGETTPTQSGGTLVVANWGGNQDEARQEVIYPAFQESTGARIVNASGVIDYGKVKAQVDSGNLEFDVVNTAPSLFFTLDPTYFEPIDYERNPELWADVINAEEYTAPEYTGAEAIMYRAEEFPNGSGPQTWSDFWDTQRFPGKRALGADGGVPWFTLETAVLSQGVAPADVYPIDMDLAFSALDDLRASGDLLIWSSVAEGAQMLASGQAVMARVVPNAVWELLESGEVSMSWENAIAWNETNHILKGTQNYDLAMDYVEFLVDPQRQADMSLLSHNGPVNQSALDLLEPEVAANLPVPPDSLDSALFQDYAWYGDNYDNMVNAWTEWQASG